MSAIPFKSEAGKGKGYCPGCGAAVKIVERANIATGNDHFNYEAEGVTLECKKCGDHQCCREIRSPQ